MSELTLNGFADFVSKQDPDKEINHWNGFEGCAVGVYVKQENTNIETLKGLLNFNEACINFVYTLPDEIRFTLNSAEVSDHYVPTYGKLNEFLQEFI